jgi:hypothetical protein
MDSEHHRVGVQTMIVQNFIPSAIEVFGVPPRLDIPDGGLPAGLSSADVHRSIVGAELARDGGLTADQSLAGVHIRFCGNDR